MNLSFLWTQIFQEQHVFNDRKMLNTAWKENEQCRENEWILKYYNQSDCYDIDFYSCLHYKAELN